MEIVLTHFLFCSLSSKGTVSSHTPLQTDAAAGNWVALSRCLLVSALKPTSVLISFKAVSISNPMLYTSTGWVQHLGISWMSLVSGACILWFLDKTMVNNFTDVPFQYTIILTYTSGDAMSHCNIDLNIVSCLHLCSGYFAPQRRFFFLKMLFLKKYISSHWTKNYWICSQRL